MIWTQNQLRLREACDVLSGLQAAGVRKPAVVGPLAWALLTKPPAVRAIPDNLMFLVSRADVGIAYQALLGAGWQPYSEAPFGDWLDWSGHVSFARDNLQLHLYWRVLTTKPEDALECERAFLARLEEIEWNGTPLLTTSPEATLLHILQGSREAGSLPWQADVLLTGTPRMNWTRFRKLALRFSPAALERLAELHRWNPLLAPPFPPDRHSLLRRKLRLFWSEYRAASYSRRNLRVGWDFFSFCKRVGTHRRSGRCPGPEQDARSITAGPCCGKHPGDRERDSTNRSQRRLVPACSRYRSHGQSMLNGLRTSRYPAGSRISASWRHIEPSHSVDSARK